MSAEAAAASSSKEEVDIESEFKKLGIQEDETKSVCATGGLIFKDYDFIKAQRRLLWDFVKAIGANISEGRDLLTVSLPVVLFEPRSFLELICQLWSFAPVLLTKAAKSNDPVYRFKCTIAMALAGLHRTCIQKKPFNPILGETYQAGYTDGSQIFCEQTSHHPPVSHFQLVGPDNCYQLWGWAGWNASFRGNSLKGHQTGPHYIDFPDGQRITWLQPDIWVRGVLFGDRVAEFLGNMVFEDHANKLKCNIQFNPDSLGFFKSLFSSPKTPTDWFRGDILQDGKKIGSVEGSWLSHVSIDGTKVIEMAAEAGQNPKPVDDPLPSDCRFRRDLIELRNNDKDAAQKAKIDMEEAQRADAKLRKEGKKKRKA